MATAASIAPSSAAVTAKDTTRGAWRWATAAAVTSSASSASGSRSIRARVLRDGVGVFGKERRQLLQREVIGQLLQQRRPLGGDILAMQPIEGGQQDQGAGIVARPAEARRRGPAQLAQHGEPLVAVQDLVAVWEIRQGPHDQGRADPLPVEVAPQGRAHRIVHDVGVRGVRMEVGERDVAQPLSAGR